MNQIYLYFVPIIFSLFLSCKSGPSQHSEKRNVSPSQSPHSNSGVDIRYILGEHHYRFLAKNQNGEVIAQSFIDQQLIREKPVNSSQYRDFINHVSDFIGGPKRALSSSAAPCRNSFSISLKIGEENRMNQGCRSSAEGSSFSRIVRDAEFLLYSQK